MSITPFTPKSVGEIELRLAELYEQTDGVPGYSDRLRSEVFDLIDEAKRFIPFDPVSAGHADEALRILYDGNARIALAKLKIAINLFLGR
jgi:hypothetical protein